MRRKGIIVFIFMRTILAPRRAVGANQDQAGRYRGSAGHLQALRCSRRRAVVKNRWNVRTILSFNVRMMLDINYRQNDVTAAR